MSQAKLLQFFKLWLVNHGATNTTIKTSKGGVLKATVSGGVVICNATTKALTLQYEELISNGGKCFYKTAYKQLGHLPVGQSAFAA